MNLSVVKVWASAYSNVIDCKTKTLCYEILRNAVRNIINVLLNTWMGPQKSKETSAEYLGGYVHFLSPS